MTLEQKAKAYDEALRMIKKELQKCGYTGCDTARQIFRYFPELEDEDEKIRKGIIHNLKYLANKAQGFVKDELEERIAWLEKQVPVDEEKVLIGARKDVALSIMNFFDKNTLGMCLSNMECEDLEDAVVNSDWLKVYRYMKKKLEKQVEQKPTLPKWKYKNDNTPLLRDSIILNKYGCVSKSPSGALVSDVWVIDYDELAKLPKFKVGDIVKDPYGDIYHIIEINNDSYKTDEGCFILFKNEDAYRLWTIADAKKGDVLACGKCILIFDQLSEFNNEQVLMDICHCTSKGFYWQDTKDRDLWVLDGFKPATKEQRDTLFAKMHEAGFEWDTEKKELKKIEQKQEENKGNLGGISSNWSEEDEKMRKVLLKMIYDTPNFVCEDICNIPKEKCIAWLEKQGEQNLIVAKSPQLGEQKSDDKVEPKFKVGDWVVENGVNGNPVQITSFEEDKGVGIKVWFSNGTGTYVDFLKGYHKWTIEDAKDGDVLEFGDHGRLVVGVVSHVNKTTGKVDVNCLLEYNNFKVGNYYNLDTIKPHPASQEQRERLFAAMHDAGYEFDFEKKELKRIEQKPATMSLDEAIEHCKKKSCSNNACALEHKQLETWLTELKELKEQTSVWSDEDEETILKMMFTFRTRVFPSSEECISFIDFLKSLKNKVQPKQEWSEKDEKTLAKACIMLDWYKGNNWWSAQYIKDWLKALKGRVGCETYCATTKEWGEEDEEQQSKD